MKKLYSLLFIFICFCGYSQNNSEVGTAKKTIEDFFTAFHAQDSLSLMQMVDPAITLKSVSEDSLGNTIVKTEEYKELVKSIISIPKDTRFKEELHSFDIRIKGMLAHIYAPYTFYLNGKISHCGIDSFELVKHHDEWKILSITDTRTKEGCN